MNPRRPAGGMNGGGGGMNGGANVLRLDEEDMIHHIDDAFSAQQMVPNTTIRVDRATLRRMKNSEVCRGGRSRVIEQDTCPGTKSNLMNAFLAHVVPLSCRYWSVSGPTQISPTSSSV